MLKSKKSVRTITRIPDDLWKEIKNILPDEKPENTIGRPVVPFRKVLDGIIFVLRTGCQWKMLPKEYGSGSTCHRRFQQWRELDIFDKLWIRLLKLYDIKKGIKWNWQSLDSISVKSPLGGRLTGSNPTDRSKLGTKRHILTDKDGIPLSTIITSANTHDVTVAIDTVDSIVIKRSSLPSSITKYRNKKKKQKQNLCLDKAYHSKEIEQEITKRGYIPHIRHRREGKNLNKRHPARRWVIERTNSWHNNRFRKLFTRYEKKDKNYLGLVQLANSIIIYRRLILG
ncbi:MAG TPA: IS5 family transposase [Nitrososphaeraceae archaeon]|nr:IS5 family transposase [Nitrososphaeraceae archaeon]